MATLQKTYSGDLTQAIAGKIWSEIRKYDDEKREREADAKVKKAAEALKREDNDSIPVVVDKDTKIIFTNMFGKVSADIVATEGKPSCAPCNFGNLPLSAGPDPLINTCTKEAVPGPPADPLNPLPVTFLI